MPVMCGWIEHCVNTNLVDSFLGVLLLHHNVIILIGYSIWLMCNRSTRINDYRLRKNWEPNTNESEPLNFQVLLQELFFLSHHCSINRSQLKSPRYHTDSRLLTAILLTDLEEPRCLAASRIRVTFFLLRIQFTVSHAYYVWCKLLHLQYVFVR